MSSQTLDPVWKALADPTRRSILDLLEEEPRTTGHICGTFPEMTRPAVLKHLVVLEEAGLVHYRRDGKLRWNEINCDPLEAVQAWLDRHVTRRSAMLQALKRHAEETND